MGKAFGELFKKELPEQLDLFFGYYLGQLEEMLEKKIPAFLAKKLTGGVHSLANEILDLNIMITKKYTKPRYYE